MAHEKKKKERESKKYGSSRQENYAGLLEEVNFVHQNNKIVCAVFGFRFLRPS